jgi:uncharacterized protein YpmB
MKRKTGWLWGMVLLMLALGGGAVWQVQHLASQIGVRHAAEIEKARTDSSLEYVLRVYPFVAEQTYTVVEGTDRSGRKMLVWVGERMVRSAYLDMGVEASVIRQNAVRAHPAWRVVRLSPGLYEGELAWELFYSQTDETDERQYGYAYYRFFDGAFMAGHQLAR